jgi:hypothetical protein
MVSVIKHFRTTSGDIGMLGEPDSGWGVEFVAFGGETDGSGAGLHFWVTGTVKDW